MSRQTSAQSSAASKRVLRRWRHHHNRILPEKWEHNWRRNFSCYIRSSWTTTTWIEKV